MRRARWSAHHILLLLIVLLGAAEAGAQQRQQGEPGKFDFYVLSLSWSPSFCEAAQERASTRSRSATTRGRFLSWCMGSGRNTSAAFRLGAKCPRRPCHARSPTACSI